MYQLLRFGLIAVGTILLLDNRRDKMPAVQRQFENFHTRIRLGEDDEKAKLREKRDVLLKTLKANLASDVPMFESFHQGSYSMHTGVIPLDGNYDIDIGIVFNCTRTNYLDPVTLKKKVRDALKSNGRTVEIRRPCVTVHYIRAGKPEYHVDLAIYVKCEEGLLEIAKGKEHSTAENRLWEKSDPKKLTQLIAERFKNGNLQQYRRCIRYMKRWRDVQFTKGAPLSIAITVAAFHWFEPYETLTGQYYDMLALLNWTKSMLSKFEWVDTAEGKHERLRIFLPLTPKADLMENMTRIQMEYFKTTLTNFRESLDSAYNQEQLEASSQVLVKLFGDDFTNTSKSIPENNSWLL